MTGKSHIINTKFPINVIQLKELLNKYHGVNGDYKLFKKKKIEIIPEDESTGAKELRHKAEEVQDKVDEESLNNTDPITEDDIMDFNFYLMRHQVKLIENNDKIRELIKSWLEDENKFLKDEDTSKYGHISKWNVSNVTDMNNLFADAMNFNQDIGKWDTSNVTNMKNMFYNALEFDRDISGWDVRKVTNMVGMFQYAMNFNQDIGKWEVSEVKNMDSMFWGCNEFNKPLNNWDVSNVTNMEGMFYNAQEFDMDISEWDVSNVTNMEGMFYFAEKFNMDISEWNVSNVENMGSMFADTSSFNQPLNEWWGKIKNVTNMEEMFFRAKKFNQDISSWDVSNVDNTGDIFKDCPINENPNFKPKGLE